MQPTGRTRIELAPRDQESVFVYWEVVDAASPGSGSSPATFLIELRREVDDRVEASLVSSERLDGAVVAVPRDLRFWATLSLLTDEGAVRLARSTTIAGPVAKATRPKFVELAPVDHGLQSTPGPTPEVKPLDWSPHKTDAGSS